MITQAAKDYIEQIDLICEIPDINKRSKFINKAIDKYFEDRENEICSKKRW